MGKDKGVELIFGGSFDPIHLGHINVIESLHVNFPDWSIRLLPCAVPALKDATSATFQQRVEMLRLVTESFDYIIIDERENSRNGKSYTIESLISLAQENQNKKHVLVVGADTLKTMKLWHQWPQLKEYCHLLLVNRPGSLISNVEEVMQQLGFSCLKNSQKLEIMPNGHYYCLNIEEKDISSTEVRSHLLSRLSVDKLLPGMVIDYIKKNSIYK